MANTYKQPTQSDLEREQFRLGLASDQNKAYTQSQENPSQSATAIDYTTAPDRISLYDLNKLDQSNAQSAPKSDSPVLDFWKRQQATKSAANADYATVPDRISLYDLGQIDKNAASATSKSDSPVLDFWKRQQAAKSAAATDYTTAPDRMPFTQANAWAGGTTAETKATNLSSAGQFAPWLNTPQYGDDGTLLLQEKLAQTGNSGYDKSTRKIGGLIDEAALDAAIAEAFPEYSPDDDDEDDWLEKPLEADDEDDWLEKPLEADDEDDWLESGDRMTETGRKMKLTPEALLNKPNSNIAYLQKFLVQNGAIDEFNNPIKTDGVYSFNTQLALADYPELVKFGKNIMTSSVAAKTDLIISSWDENNLNPLEQEEISKIDEIMQDAISNNDLQGVQQAYQQEEVIRSKYRLSFEYTDKNGQTYISASKLNEFSENAMKKYGTQATEIPSYVIAGAIASQLDTPLPGPADLVGLLIIVGGIIISEASAFFAKGKSDPKDLEKGMTLRQKEKYYEAIHEFKRGCGMPPNANIPWEILVALAEEVKELFKKG